jgi:hypothetical protein
MSQNPTRTTLSKKLEEAELRYDISRMITERNYHISQTQIFDEAINAQKENLKSIHEPEMADGEIHK